MKSIAIIVTIVTVVASAASSQEVVSTSFADVFNTDEARLSSLSATRKVEDTAAPAVNTVYFATTLSFPLGTTSVNMTAVKFTLTKKVNGSAPVVLLFNKEMNESQYNPEGDISTPSIFARSSGVLLPMSGNLCPSNLGLLPSALYITEHKVALGSGSFQKMTQIGDYYTMERKCSGTYTLGDTVFPFTDITSTAKVEIVNQISAPVTGISDFWPNNPVCAGSTSNSFTLTGLSVDSYLKNWWVETSTDMVNWSPDTGVTVSPDVIIGFTVDPLKPKKFWRVGYLEK